MRNPVLQLVTSDSILPETWGEVCGKYRCGPNTFCTTPQLVYRDGTWIAEKGCKCLRHFSGVPDTKEGCSCENNCCKDPSKSDCKKVYEKFGKTKMTLGGIQKLRRQEGVGGWSVK